MKRRPIWKERFYPLDRVPCVPSCRNCAHAHLASGFAQSRHQFDEVARAIAAVELLGKDAVPTVLHRAVGAWQGEDVRAPRNHSAGARLDGAGADGLETEPAEQLAKAGNVACPRDPAESFWRDIAACQACAAGADDGVNMRVVDPAIELLRQKVRIVFHDGAGRERVPGTCDTFGKDVARCVILSCAGVGDGQDGDVDRREGLALVDRHGGGVLIAANGLSAL